MKRRLHFTYTLAAQKLQEHFDTCNLAGAELIAIVHGELTANDSIDLIQAVLPARDQNKADTLGGLDHGRMGSDGGQG